MLASRKDENILVLPRDDCNVDQQEHPEKAAIRLLHDKAGIEAHYLAKRLGCFSESNKKGRVVAHHWMYEVHNPILLDDWPESNRKRVWVSWIVKQAKKKKNLILSIDDTRRSFKGKWK